VCPGYAAGGRELPVVPSAQRSPSSAWRRRALLLKLSAFPQPHCSITTPAQHPGLRHALPRNSATKSCRFLSLSFLLEAGPAMNVSVPAPARSISTCGIPVPLDDSQAHVMVRVVRTPLERNLQPTKTPWVATPSSAQPRNILEEQPPERPSPTAAPPPALRLTSSHPPAAPARSTAACMFLGGRSPIPGRVLPNLTPGPVPWVFPAPRRAARTKAQARGLAPRPSGATTGPRTAPSPGRPLTIKDAPPAKSRATKGSMPMCPGALEAHASPTAP